MSKYQRRQPTLEEIEARRRGRRDVRRKLAQVETHKASLARARTALGEAFRDAQRTGIRVEELEAIADYSHATVYKYMRLDKTYEDDKKPTNAWRDEA